MCAKVGIIPTHKIQPMVDVMFADFMWKISKKNLTLESHTRDEMSAYDWGITKYHQKESLLYRKRKCKKWKNRALHTTIEWHKAECSAKVTELPSRVNCLRFILYSFSCCCYFVSKNIYSFLSFLLFLCIGYTFVSLKVSMACEPNDFGSLFEFRIGVAFYSWTIHNNHIKLEKVIRIYLVSKIIAYNSAI